MEPKTDFLGNTYNVGDPVLYAAARGRSITMIKGTVLEVKENGSVKIQPELSSRWKQHSTPSWYIDSRTNKRIYAWLPEHIKRPSCYIHKLTGTTYTHQMRQDYLFMHGWGRANEFEYKATEFNDYVQEVTEEKPRPVTIKITENIVRWLGSD